MSLFGEINIPLSRILWDDDYEEIQDTNENVSLNWDNVNVVPTKKIDTLILIESTKLTQLAQICLLSENEPICKIVDINLRIYKITNDKYIVLYENNNKATSGEIVEKLIPWLKIANKIMAFNSMPSVTYQCNSNEEKPVTFIRSLSTGNVKTLAPMLEAPNLATGLSAGVFSYCQYCELPASLYICYLEPRQLDSMSAEPILNLMKKINITNVKPYKINPVNNDSFLYM